MCFYWGALNFDIIRMFCVGVSCCFKRRNTTVSVLSLFYFWCCCCCCSRRSSALKDKKIIKSRHSTPIYNATQFNGWLSVVEESSPKFFHSFHAHKKAPKTTKNESSAFRQMIWEVFGSYFNNILLTIHKKTADSSYTWSDSKEPSERRGNERVWINFLTKIFYDLRSYHVRISHDVNLVLWFSVRNFIPLLLSFRLC